MKMKHSLYLVGLVGLVHLAKPNIGDSQPVTNIAAGSHHSLFIKADGSLWAMGEDDSGQLGDGNFGYYGVNYPEEIVATGVTAAACGSQHSLFVQGGNLWGMGYNGNGGLGDGTYNSQGSPEFVVPGGVAAIGAGYNDSLFLMSDGSLWAMGYNDYGELGDGMIRTMWYTNVPEQVMSTGVTAIAVGNEHTLFLKQDGSLWGMGEDMSGELGDGTTGYAVSAPERILSSNVVAIAAGNGHSLVLKSDGSLWAMGDNYFGQLGDGTTNIQSLLPERIVASGVKAISAGSAHSLFLKKDGSLWAMGYNAFGELGDGTFNNTNRPEQIVAGGVTAIAAGGIHSLFLKSDGSLWGMGDNSEGQLGVGTISSTNLPVQILAGWPVYNQVQIQISAGGIVNISFIGNPTVSYSLEATFNLAPANWTSLMTNAADSNGVVTFTNVPAGATNTFWRTRSVP